MNRKELRHPEGAASAAVAVIKETPTKSAKSWAASPAVRRAMQGNKSRDTKPEMAVRRALHAMGLRYRIAARPLAGLSRTADLVFRRARIAVFVDGCFWHGCPAHHAPPRTNAIYWAAKIKGNKARDRDTTILLRAAGWTVLRFWSHEDPSAVAANISQVVRDMRANRNKQTTEPVTKGSLICQ
jgi:DNA mismatch endonuclease (patch repair protein)